MKPQKTPTHTVLSTKKNIEREPDHKQRFLLGFIFFFFRNERQQNIWNNNDKKKKTHQLTAPEPTASFTHRCNKHTYQFGILYFVSEVNDDGLSQGTE